jgi:hypothetical protein
VFESLAGQTAVWHLWRNDFIRLAAHRVEFIPDILWLLTCQFLHPYQTGYHAAERHPGPSIEGKLSWPFCHTDFFTILILVESLAQICFGFAWLTAHIDIPVGHFTGRECAWWLALR